MTKSNQNRLGKILKDPMLNIFEYLEPKGMIRNTQVQLESKKRSLPNENPCKKTDF